MTFVADIAARLSEVPERTAIATEGVTVSGAALLSRAAAFRQTLLERGIRPGDRVALLANSSADWVACDLAVLAEGAALVPLDPRQAPDEVAALIVDAAPFLLVTEDDCVAIDRRSDDGTLVGKPPRVPRISLSALGAGGPARWTAPRVMPPDAVATLIYTSGSSGEPKGAVLTRSNLTFMLDRTAARLAQLTGLLAGSERILHYLPLCYAGSRVLLLSALLRGARVDLLSDPRKLGDALPAAAPDTFLNVPLVLDRFRRAATDAIQAKGAVPTRLLARATEAFERRGQQRDTVRDRLVLALADRLIFRSLRARFGGRLKGLICGSALLSLETQHFFQMAGIEIYQGYGLTETTALCTLDVEGFVRSGWVGPALPDVQLRRSDDGEILTRGPHVFAGYWGRPEATARVFTRDGWFRTGDLGEVDAEGRWRITGRASAVLVLGTGHNVAPEPLEAALSKTLQELEPSAADAHVVVLGHGRPYPVALVASDGAVTDALVERALAILNPTLSAKKRLHGSLAIAEPFSAEEGTLTANLKLRRAAIAERYATQIDALYEREPARV